MLVVISPAKKIDMSEYQTVDISEPLFTEKTQELVNVMQSLDVEDIKNLMGISNNLAKLNADRFLNFGAQERKAAIFAFAGDTYQGLDAKTLEHADLIWAQSNLRIISGLYGLLRPLDEIEPYRLEMGSRLSTGKGKNLYEFWGSQLSNSLNEIAQETNSEALINCASKEYFSAVDRKNLEMSVITPSFLESNNGKPKIISFYAKRARGAMARFVLQHRIKKRSELEMFQVGGYKYQPDMSDQSSMIFLR